MALATRATALCMALAMALAGCSSQSSGQNYILGALKTLVASKKAAAATKPPGQVTRTELAALGGPVMRFKIASRGIDSFLVRYQQSGPIAVWTDGSGTTFTFRNG